MAEEVSDLTLFFRDPFMSRQGLLACSAESYVTAMCQFEMALAEVQAKFSIIPVAASRDIHRLLKDWRGDIAQLSAEVADGGNVAIPFVAAVRKQLPDAVKPWFHYGATSQDVVDSSLMLLLKPQIEACWQLLVSVLRDGVLLMEHHAETPMIARTLMQQALPITFGVKVGQWLSGLWAAAERLKLVLDKHLWVQFGGPVGVHHDVASGLEVMKALADELGLTSPLLPWHTNRQPILFMLDALDAVATASEKIALDIILMQQTEVGELQEPSLTGKGGSSSMPHKRNPIGCIRIRAAAQRVHAACSQMHYGSAQLHERAVGEWHNEWSVLVDSVLCVRGLLETLSLLLPKLEVNVGQMRRNLGVTHGANLRKPTLQLLTKKLSLEEAQAAAEEAVKQARGGVSYTEALAQLPVVAAQFSSEEIMSELSVVNYIGDAKAQVEQVKRLIISGLDC